MQLDLGAAYTVDQVKVWHYARDGRTYHNTKTQVSANGSTWVTVFDSAVSGEYAETAAGKTHTFSPRSVRYVRDWLNGSTSNSGNHWVEIEVWGTRTRVYAGQHYEKNINSGEVTKYYHFGGSRVAMRRGSVVQYLLADHLNSTALTLNSSGSRVAELRYRAFGETRYNGTPSGTPTDYRFTGQRQDSGLGLYHMGARWYDPYLNRFLSPDSIIPQPANPQSLNRYSYVYNRPLVYVDSSGHIPIPLIIGAGILILKAVDYGWTAWDTYQSGRTLADPDASSSDKMAAGLNIATGVAFELIEPDDVLPAGLPLDDVARKAVVKGAREAFEAGGEKGMRSFFRNSLGNGADEVLRHVNDMAPIFSTDELLEGAAVLDRNGLTKAGRALQKHSGRAGSSWTKPLGTLNPAGYNSAAQDMIGQILSDSGTTSSYLYRSGYGWVYEVIAGDGRGLRFDANGVLIGFLEP